MLHCFIDHHLSSYKEQSSGEGSSGGGYEFLPGEDYYYEEEQDNRPTIEKVHRMYSIILLQYVFYMLVGLATKNWKNWRYVFYDTSCHCYVQVVCKM